MRFRKNIWLYIILTSSLGCGIIVLPMREARRTHGFSGAEGYRRSRVIRLCAVAFLATERRAGRRPKYRLKIESAAAYRAVRRGAMAATRSIGCGYVTGFA